jgi:site-specific recombinase XerC
MGRKSALTHDIFTKANQKGGSHLTREGRKTTAKQLVNWFSDNKIQIGSVKQIKVDHIKTFIDDQIKLGIGKRTLCNKMSNIRSALIAAGLGSLANSSEISNRTLGITGGARTGAKRAIPNEIFAEVLHKIEFKDPGVAAVARLQRALGLRVMEGLRCSNLETLSQWKLQLSDEIVHIKQGTKGGRPRVATLHELNQAYDAIENARIIAEINKGYCVIARDLKQAYYRVNNVYRSCGLKEYCSSHSLRYAWAQDQLRHYLEEGFSQREARKKVSQDLGHGDGRGRYVASVYLRQ